LAGTLSKVKETSQLELYWLLYIK